MVTTCILQWGVGIWQALYQGGVLSFSNIIGYYRSTGRLVGGPEHNISRILYLCRLSTTQVAIIYLGRQLPVASCDQPES